MMLHNTLQPVKLLLMAFCLWRIRIYLKQALLT